MSLARLSLPAIFAAAMTAASLGCGTTDSPASSEDAAVSSQDGGSTTDANDDGTGAADAGADTSAPAGPPKPVSYSAGQACPTLTAGENKFWSWGLDRMVDIYLPPKPAKANLLFLWHGLGGTKEGFGNFMKAKKLANSLGAIVVVPQGGAKLTGWGWDKSSNATEDAALFDDLLSCIDQQWDIDNSRVWTMGFSAGGLWSSWLTLHRSTYIASAVIWSGGSGTESNKYKTPKRKIPVLMAWGGPEDKAGFAFQETTLRMSSMLRTDGHFVVTCDHNLGHNIPFGWEVWAADFLKRHPWGVTESDLATSAAIQTSMYPKYCTFKASK
ncbi:MAG: prolyl oligopeptidase family serine peptidase [Myxococcales bacterium]|nr:prolyl oligopeptidase family serine peptidase [Myxococcales bacterium]